MFNKTILFSVILLLSLAGCSSFLGPQTDVIPTTNLVFSLPEPGHVRVWIENSYKTEVISVIDEHLEAGTYEIPIEMKDSKGKRLPEGLYTMNIKSGPHSSSNVMLLNYNY
jgi:hypothetical protein